MSAAFDNLPELYELIILNLSIVVVVYSIEEFLGRNLSEALGPVFNGLVLLYGLRIIFVEHVKHFVNHLCALGG
jgi:hypothetical protein